MFDKAMKKSIDPYMEPGEEPLDVMIVQGKGMIKALIGGGAVGAAVIGGRRDRKSQAEAEAGNGGGIQLSSKMGLAITPRRLLLFKAGGAMTLKATELLTAVPIADVDSVEVGKGALTKPVIITVRGESFQVEAPKAANTDRLVEAFTKAKAGAPA